LRQEVRKSQLSLVQPIRGAHTPLGSKQFLTLTLRNER